MLFLILSKIEIDSRGEPPHLPRDILLPAKFGTKIRRSAAVTGIHGVCFNNLNTMNSGYGTLLHYL
jgi:hypothetical protein